MKFPITLETHGEDCDKIEIKSVEQFIEMYLDCVAHVVGKVTDSEGKVSYHGRASDEKEFLEYKCYDCPHGNQLQP